MISEGRFPPRADLSCEDERFMYQALIEAWKAFDKEEVPVGAVVVCQGQIIGRGHNQVELLQDATAHAEMLAIGAAAQALSNWRLEDCTLYSTLEPCMMCAGALFVSRVCRVIYGAKDHRHGAHGSLCNLFALPHPMHTIEVQGSVLQSWCAHPMQQFFKMRRSLT
jgi:tRNA(adenine34) deaminase